MPCHQRTGIESQSPDFCVRIRKWELRDIVSDSARCVSAAPREQQIVVFHGPLHPPDDLLKIVGSQREIGISNAIFCEPSAHLPATLAGPELVPGNRLHYRIWRPLPV